ncbi:MAG TPA: DUF6542 domain-containing protein [Streptosporangiaceae bacterium]
MRRRSAGSSLTLTGRGGIVVILGGGLLAQLVGSAAHLGFLPGLGFVVACAVAAATTRGGDLLTVVVSPPLVFLVITLVSEFLGAIGEPSVSRSMLVGVVTTFAARAPWLFLGTVLAIVLAVPRGLPATLRALRTVRPVAQAETGADRGAGSAKGAGSAADDDPVRWDN